MGLAPLMFVLAGVAVAQPSSTRMVLLVDGQLQGEARDEALDALEIFGALARDEDRLGVVEIGTEPRVLLSPSSDRSRLRVRMDGARSQPFGLEATLEKALDLLGPRHPRSRDVLVFVVGRNPRPVDVEALQTLIEDVRVRRASVHLVALGPDPSHELLQVPRATGGSFSVRPERLHRTLFDIAVTEEQVDLLTTKGGAFRVDEDVKAFAAVLTLLPQGPNALLSPDESVLRGPLRQKNLSWMSRAGFDLVQIENPVPGSWRADQPKLDQLEVLVRQGLTQLDIQLEPRVPIVGRPAMVVGRLIQDGHPVLSFARLKELEMRFLLPEGKELPLDRAKDGRFVGRWTPEEAGEFRGQLLAETPTMKRHRKARFRVSPPCFDAEASWSENRVDVVVRRLGVCNDLVELVVRAKLHRADGEPTELGLRPEGDVFRGSLPFDAAPTYLSLAVRALEFGQVRRFPLAPIRAPELEPPSSVWGIVARVGLAHSPLGLIAIGFWFRRRLDGVEGGAGA
ncbi:MAG: VWA domain-containing protein [Myxococcota bacterium]